MIVAFYHFYNFIKFIRVDLFDILIHCKIIGQLSPTTRVETSFDSGGATKVEEKNAVPSHPTVKDESAALSAATGDKVKLSVVQFAEEDPVLKWFLRIMTVMLLVCLVFLWVYYR